MYSTRRDIARCALATAFGASATRLEAASTSARFVIGHGSTHHTDINGLQSGTNPNARNAAHLDNSLVHVAPYFTSQVPVDQSALDYIDSQLMIGKVPATPTRIVDPFSEGLGVVLNGLGGVHEFQTPSGITVITHDHAFDVGGGSQMSNVGNILVGTNTGINFAALKPTLQAMTQAGLLTATTTAQKISSNSMLFGLTGPAFGNNMYQFSLSISGGMVTIDQSTTAPVIAASSFHADMRLAMPLGIFGFIKKVVAKVSHIAHAISSVVHRVSRYIPKQLQRWILDRVRGYIKQKAVTLLPSIAGYLG